MAEGKIFHAQYGTHCVIRLVGELRYTCAPVMDRFIERIFTVGGFEDLVIDLTDAESIDSTCLGLLARIANLMETHHGRMATIVSTRKDINTILESVGFDEVFAIVDTPLGCPPRLERVEGSSLHSKDEIERIVLKAHKTLSELSEKNREMFKRVVEELEEPGTKQNSP